MVVFEEKNGKIECFDDITNNKFIFDDILSMKHFIENFTAKFDRYVKGAPGFENRKWFGIYSVCPNEIFEDVLKIMEKHKNQIEIEIKELENKLSE